MTDPSDDLSKLAPEENENESKNVLLRLVRSEPWKINVYVFVFCSLLSCFSGISYIADLFCQFRLQMAAGLIVIVLVQYFVLRAEKTRVLFVVSTAALALNLACLGLAYWPTDFFNDKKLSDLNGPRVRVLQFNLNNKNHSYAAVEQYVRDVQPDVICFEEYSSGWSKNLPYIEANYPNKIVRVRDDSFGVAIFSRNPLEHAEIISLGKAYVPSAFAETIIMGLRWGFLVTHPLPPVRASWAGLRNQQFKAVADFALKYKSAAPANAFVVCGDLNCVPWSAHYMAFLAGSKLHDSSAGFPLEPTWPTFCWPLRIPLDHVFTTNNVHVVERTMGPDLGSDHLPVFVQLSTL